MGFLLIILIKIYKLKGDNMDKKLDIPLEDTKEKEEKRTKVIESIIGDLVSNWIEKKDMRKLRVDIEVPNVIKNMISKTCNKYEIDQIEVESEIFSGLVGMGMATLVSISIIEKEKKKQKQESSPEDQKEIKTKGSVNEKTGE